MTETVISWSPPNIVSIALMMLMILTIIGLIAKLVSGKETT